MMPMTARARHRGKCRTSRSVLRGYYALLIALLYLPIAVLVLFSLNANQVLAFPAPGIHARVVRQRPRHTPGVSTAARNSVLVATGSSLMATMLATMVAILVARYQLSR